MGTLCHRPVFCNPNTALRERTCGSTLIKESDKGTSCQLWGCSWAIDQAGVRGGPLLATCPLQASSSLGPDSDPELTPPPV